jgi:hypothetical protein
MRNGRAPILAAQGGKHTGRASALPAVFGNSYPPSLSKAINQSITMKEGFLCHSGTADALHAFGNWKWKVS